MGKSSKKVTKTEAAAVVATPIKSLKKGKREAEELIEKKVVSAKKQKVEEKKIESKNDKKVLKKKVESSSEDDSSSESEELPKVKALPAKNGVAHSDSDSEESSGVEEAPKKAPAAPAKNGKAAPKKKEESSDDESSEDESSSDDEDVPATKKATPAAAAKKKDESSSEEESSSDEDDALAKKAAPAKKAAALATKKKDDSSSEDESSSDEDVALAKKAPATTPAAPKKDESSDESESEESDEESSEDEDEKPAKTPKKTGGDVKMTEADNTPKTPSTPNVLSGGSKTLFVGNLAFSIEQADVENFFKSAGEVVDVRFAMGQDNSFRGFGHVEFATAEAAAKAMELNGQELLGREVRLDMAKERGAATPFSGGRDSQSFQRGGAAQGQTVFIRGFNKFDGEDQIRSALEEHFGGCGEITRVSIPKDQEGGVKGIAYVDFTEGAAVNKALELSGSQLGDITLYVDEAKPRDNNASGGGRGGGRGFGRSGGRDSGGRFGGGGRRGGGRGGRDSGGRFSGGGRSGGRGYGNKPSFASSGKKTTFDD
ncbi:nucleolin 1-like [Salvia splendens]|uniref:nucleolin 1-like n=1 Tax=Salvia splendens TaxID=180675 RepID=UPI001C2670FF|nr:nucleolin 1-like [Salvia splendens]